MVEYNQDPHLLRYKNFQLKSICSFSLKSD
jgi:hypothetical protein